MSFGKSKDFPEKATYKKAIKVLQEISWLITDDVIHELLNEEHPVDSEAYFSLMELVNP